MGDDRVKRLDLRLTEQEHALIKAAAERNRRSITSYVIWQALQGGQTGTRPIAADKDEIKPEPRTTTPVRAKPSRPQTETRKTTPVAEPEVVNTSARQGLIKVAYGGKTVMMTHAELDALKEKEAEEERQNRSRDLVADF